MTFNVCFVFLSLRGETVEPRSHSNDRNYIKSLRGISSDENWFFFLFAALETIDVDGMHFKKF